MLALQKHANRLQHLAYWAILWYSIYSLWLYKEVLHKVSADLVNSESQASNRSKFCDMCVSVWLHEDFLRFKNASERLGDCLTGRSDLRRGVTTIRRVRVCLDWTVCVTKFHSPADYTCTHHHQPIPKRLNSSLPRRSEHNADHIASSKSHIIVLSN